MTRVELERRRPLWSAMSDLFLDTEVRWSVPSVAKACADSGYDAAALERIFWGEVFPEAIGNLLQVAGEWGLLELDEAALVRRAEAGSRLSPLRHASAWMVESEWKAALALAPWLEGADAQLRVRALDLLGRRYFEEPGALCLLATPERARAVGPLLHAAWEHYAPIAQSMLLRDERASQEDRARAVRQLLAAVPR